MVNWPFFNCFISLNNNPDVEVEAPAGRGNEAAFGALVMRLLSHHNHLGLLGFHKLYKDKQFAVQVLQAIMDRVLSREKLAKMEDVERYPDKNCRCSDIYVER